MRPRRAASSPGTAHRTPRPGPALFRVRQRDPAVVVAATPQDRRTPPPSITSTGPTSVSKVQRVVYTPNHASATGETAGDHHGRPCGLQPPGLRPRRHRRHRRRGQRVHPHALQPLPDQAGPVHHSPGRGRHDHRRRVRRTDGRAATRPRCRVEPSWASPGPWPRTGSTSRSNFATARHAEVESEHLPTDTIDAWQAAGPEQVRAAVATRLAQLGARGLLDIARPPGQAADQTHPAGRRCRRPSASSGHRHQGHRGDRCAHVPLRPPASSRLAWWHAPGHRDRADHRRGIGQPHRHPVRRVWHRSRDPVGQRAIRDPGGLRRQLRHGLGGQRPRPVGRRLALQRPHRLDHDRP